MKKFNIKVNGNSYEVEVEEVRERLATPAPQPARLVKPPFPKLAPAAPAAAPKPAPSKAGERMVCSPMPGMIVEIKVKEGEAVKQGQALLILEAMKMENEIPAPADGKVVSIKVAAGASVQSGDILVVLK